MLGVIPLVFRKEKAVKALILMIAGLLATTLSVLADGFENPEPTFLPVQQGRCSLALQTNWVFRFTINRPGHVYIALATPEYAAGQSDDNEGIEPLVWPAGPVDESGNLLKVVEFNRLWGMVWLTPGAYELTFFPSSEHGRFVMVGVCGIPPR